MKIAHFGNFSPNRAGIHTAARDLILAERSAGLESNYIDWGSEKDATFSRVWLKDGDVESVSPDWAREADIIVHHSCIPKQIDELHKPIVMYLHGRPEYSFMLDWENKTGCLREEMHLSEKVWYKKFITFWPEHLNYWKYILPDADMAVVPPPIDLSRYSIEGKKYQFKPVDKGNPNILICTMWREDITPFNTIIAVMKFVEEYCSSAKIHIVAIPTPVGPNTPEPIGHPLIGRMIAQLRRTGFLGLVSMIIPNLDELMRACDFVVSPLGIETRGIMEANALGVPVVAGTKNPLALFTADPRSIDDTVRAIKKSWDKIKNYPGNIRKDTRKKLEKNYGLVNTGVKVKELYKEILNGKI